MLSADVRRYVELHQSIGFKFRAQRLLLSNFVSFAKGKGDQFIQTTRAIEWAGQAPSAPQRYNRLATLHRCAISLHAEQRRHQVPPDDVFGRQWFKRKAPRLYTPGQIARLIAEAKKLGPKNSIRPMTYATLFGLLAATGLRVSEALALKITDLTMDGLIIRATKFKKDRLIVVHPSTRKAILRYLESRRKLTGTDDTLFVSTTGQGIPYSTVVAAFLKLMRRSGMRGASGTPGPRLHDLRHTFAVRSLEQCGTDRNSIARHMAGLSTYLGHAHISDTYWYLQATPVLMRKIAKAGEALHSGEGL